MATSFLTQKFSKPFIRNNVGTRTVLVWDRHHEHYEKIEEDITPIGRVESLGDIIRRGLKPECKQAFTYGLIDTRETKTQRAIRIQNDFETGTKQLYEAQSFNSQLDKINQQQQQQQEVNTPIQKENDGKETIR